MLTRKMMVGVIIKVEVTMTHRNCLTRWKKEKTITENPDALPYYSTLINVKSKKV
jgi:hypothetical protein